MSGAEALIALTAVGTGFQVISAVAQGQSQASMAEYNAKVAEAQAAQVREAAAFEERRSRDSARRFLSTQRALYGASGVTVEEGSPLLVMADTAAESELDALAIRYSGSVEAARAQSQAALDRMSAQTYRQAGYLDAGASLLTGASTLSRYRLPSSSPKRATGGAGTSQTQLAY